MPIFGNTPDLTSPGWGFLYPRKAIKPLPDTAVLTPQKIIEAEITATQAAAYCGVAVCTITKWAREGRINPVGTNGSGRKLYRLLDVAKAEHATKERARR
jgi:hypothetical protein